MYVYICYICYIKCYICYMIYVYIIKSIFSVTYTKPNIAPLAIYLAVPSFTKTTVHFLFAKFGPMMDTIIADVGDRYRH